MQGLDVPSGVRLLGSYTLATYLVSWTCWVLWSGVAAERPLAGTVLFVAGGFGPFLVGLAFVRAGGGDVRAWLASIFRVRVDGRYYVLALALPAAVVLVAATAHVLLFDGRLTPELLPGPGEYPLLLAFILLFGGGQEEPGWRGYLLPRLQETYSALAAALLIGVVWAGWHLPLFVLPGTIQAEMTPWLYLPQVVATSVVLTWLTNAVRGSVLPAMLLHAGANAVVNYYPPGGVAGAISPLGYGLLTAVLVAFALALVVTYGGETLAPGDRDVSTPDRAIRRR